MKKLVETTVLAATTTLALLGIQTEAKALLIGDSVRGRISLADFGFLGFDQTAVVGTGIEFNSPSDRTFVDISDDFFEISFIADGFSSTGLPLTWTISDLDWAGTPGGITGVSLISGKESLISGLFFTDSSITVNFSMITFPPEVQSWKFAINQNASDAVPTPTTVPTPTVILPILGSLFIKANLKRNISKINA